MTAPRIVSTKSPASRPPEPNDGVYYPVACDVLPPEGMIHFVPQSYMQSALEAWLDDSTTLVAAQMFIYYEPGNPRAFVSPDVYVIPNVGNAMRNSYFLWLEQEAPIFAMEVSSPSTYRNDLGSKHDLYESWGVQEYWQYDPHARFLTPPLQGNRLVDGSYQPIPVDVDAHSGRCVAYSATVNLELHAGREWFRFADPATGRIIPNRQEVEQDLAQERAARQALETLLRQHGIEPPASD